MRIRLRHLVVRTRKTVEHINFSDVVTLLHGPVSTGKSTVARLVDFCLGGNLERTPAIQQEFVAAQLSLVLGNYDCSLERAADDAQSVRVTWSGPDDDIGSVNAPLGSQTETLLDDAEVYSLSDLVFHLCGVTPIKVRQRSRDPDSPLIRLSIRDIWWYCYLDQTHLDSSFFRLEDPFRGRKSQDAMRFFTGLHSERLSQLEDDLIRTIDQQRSKREAVQQIRSFMTRFDLGSEANMAGQLQAAQRELAGAEDRRKELERTRSSQTHPTDALRNELRRLSTDVERIRQAIADSAESIAEQKALRAEFITAKTKAARVDQAGKILFEGVRYQRCPECGSDISDRPYNTGPCRLCGSFQPGGPIINPLEFEAMQRDLNERIDQIADSIVRRQNERSRMLRQLAQMEEQKASLDRQLQEELARYDSAFIESMRAVEREIATLVERIPISPAATTNAPGHQRIRRRSGGSSRSDRSITNIRCRGTKSHAGGRCKRSGNCNGVQAHNALGFISRSDRGGRSSHRPSELEAGCCARHAGVDFLGLRKWRQEDAFQRLLRPCYPRSCSGAWNASSGYPDNRQSYQEYQRRREPRVGPIALCRDLRSRQRATRPQTPVLACRLRYRQTKYRLARLLRAPNGG